MKDVILIDYDEWIETAPCISLLICAAGFEDRALTFLRDDQLMSKASEVVIVSYSGGPKTNERSLKLVEQYCVGKVTTSIEFPVADPQIFSGNVERSLDQISIETNGVIAIDIGGMPQMASCILLAEIRRRFPLSRFLCFYASAATYPPSEKSISEELSKVEKEGPIAYPTTSQAKAFDVVFPPQFSGAQDKLDSTFLCLFAGLDIRRSVSVCDSINPARILCIIGAPGPEYSPLRVKLATQLHSDICCDIERSDRIIDNLDVQGVIETLDSFYQYLYSDHTIVLAPVSSKLQALGAFLFWEEYPDVQMVFPIPLEYDEQGGGVGIGKRFVIPLPPPPKAALLFAGS